MSQSYDDILARLVDYLTEYLEEAPSKPIDGNSDLVVDLNLDSIQRFEMVADLEDHYDVSLSLEAFQEVGTLGDVAKLITESLS